MKKQEQFLVCANPGCRKTFRVVDSKRRTSLYHSNACANRMNAQLRKEAGTDRVKGVYATHAELRAAVFTMRNLGLTITDIAIKTGISKSSVSRIIKES